MATREERRNRAGHDSGCYNGNEDTTDDGTNESHIDPEGRFVEWNSVTSVPADVYELNDNIYIGAMPIVTGQGGENKFIGVVRRNKGLEYVNLASDPVSAEKAVRNFEIYCFNTNITNDPFRWEWCQKGSMPRSTAGINNPAPVDLGKYNFSTLYLGRMKIDSKYEYGTIIWDGGKERYKVLLIVNGVVQTKEDNFEVLCINE